MASMKTSITWASLVFLVCFTLVGCSQAISPPLMIPTETLYPLTPYRTPTATRPVPTSAPLATIPVTPIPSATPFFHLVTRGETMLGIALKYGVTLEALQAANPGIDPQFLPVDAQLIIPLGDVIQAEIHAPTPVNLAWANPTCYPTGEGGLWCYLLVENTLATAVENLSAWIGLYDENGSIVASAIAAGLINILRPGDAMPLIAYFDPPLPSRLIPRGELLTAVEIPSDDMRYRDWQVSDLSVAVRGETSREVLVTGALQQAEGSALPGQVWIMAVAYDSAGKVVGVRKIETRGELGFQVMVYSLGEAIDQVEILAEIRP